MNPVGHQHPPLAAVREVVARALAEDLGPLGDLTAALVPADATASAVLVPRADGVLAGRLAAGEAFAQVDGAVRLRWSADDGDRVASGRPLATVEGPLRSVLTAERTALIRDTRKTTPGLRALEKAAVRAGGGANHRGSLSDGILIKDNHLGGVTVAAAVATARRQWPGRAVQVECDAAGQVREAVAAGADLVLLDNMSPDEVADCVAELEAAAGDRLGGRCPVEVSGGVTLASVAAYARAGAELISVGAITHSAPVLDIGLDLDPMES